MVCRVALATVPTTRRSKIAVEVETDDAVTPQYHGVDA